MRLIFDLKAIQHVKLLSFDHRMDGGVLNYVMNQYINQSENQLKQKQSQSQVFFISMSHKPAVMSPSELEVRFEAEPEINIKGILCIF